MYKVKPLHHREDISRCLVKKLQFKAVRLLKRTLKSLKPQIFEKEHAGTQLVSCLPTHKNVLKQVVIGPGASVSNLYDCNLKDYTNFKKLRREGIQCVLEAITKAVQHLHINNVGHFDIKPSNILV